MISEILTLCKRWILAGLFAHRGRLSIHCKVLGRERQGQLLPVWERCGSCQQALCSSINRWCMFKEAESESCRAQQPICCLLRVGQAMWYVEPCLASGFQRLRKWAAKAKTLRIMLQEEHVVHDFDEGSCNLFGDHETPGWGWALPSYRVLAPRDLWSSSSWAVLTTHAFTSSRSFSTWRQQRTKFIGDMVHRTAFFNLMALCHVHWMWPTSVGNWPSRPVTLHHQSLDGYKFMPKPSANAGRNLWMAWDSKLLI